MVSSKFSERMCTDASDESWCLDILRTEAQLRLGKMYIDNTRQWFDVGQAPPASLDFAVERQALFEHGWDGDDTAVVEAYRSAARALPIDVRAEIFFLRANDRLFHPDALLLEEPLRGFLLQPRRTSCGAASQDATSFENVLAKLPRAIVVASTAS